ncbi:MAG: translocation/assembly module TamB domain-containing protein [Candidatus Omnitrophota bacterium]
MTMRYRTKIIIFFLTGLILYFGTVRTAEFISEKYVYKVISYKIRKNIREQWGADLYMGRVNGNIFTHTNLENVYVAGFKGIDKDLRFEADYIKLSYKPAGILFGKFKAEFGKPRIIYKGISYPLEISHHEEITAILFRNKKVNLSLVSAVLAKDFFLDGTAQAQGEIILKNFKPCLFDISIKSYDARLEYPSYLNALGSICLEIKGSTRNPLLSGDIKLTKIYLPPGMEDASFEEIYKSYFNPDSLKDYIINVCIHGEKVSLEGNNFSALVNGSVELKKNIDENPFLLGRIDIVKGTYAACRNTFNI